MNARRNKIRVSRLFHGRFHSRFIWQSAEDIAWERMAPVGREFGSRDFDRLMQEDYDSHEGVFSLQDLPMAQGNSVTRLKGMFGSGPKDAVTIEDMNPGKPGSRYDGHVG